MCSHSLRVMESAHVVFARYCTKLEGSALALRRIDCATHKAFAIDSMEDSRRNTKIVSTGWVAANRYEYDRGFAEMLPRLESLTVVCDKWRSRGVFASLLPPPFVLIFLQES